MALGWIFEPEETVGTYWHNLADRIGAETAHGDAAVAFADLRPSLAVLFRALGGPASVDLGEAAPVRATHRRRLRRRVTHGAESAVRPNYDGARLRLAPVVSCFADASLNRAVYFWQVAAAALADLTPETLPAAEATPGAQDASYLRLNSAVTSQVLASCPGLRDRHAALCSATLAARLGGPGALDRAVAQHLKGLDCEIPAGTASGGQRIAPVPFWLDFLAPVSGDSAVEDANPSQPPPGAAMTRRKLGERRDLDQTDRKDSFIVHRFESILSWVESMNINRSVDDDDDENARKAADDQDRITLSKHHKKAATRLRLHLDLSPAEARHECLADKLTYPEWDHRRARYMPDHCRVLEAEAEPAEEPGAVLDARRAEQVRRQFETLRPRRILRPRQQDGAELDLDALIQSRADLAATGRGSNRIYLDTRRIERDLSIGLLLDISRSTEADMDGSTVIDVARDALSALSHGLEACGDRFAIWGFSSLRRNRVFFSRCKDFDAPMSRAVDARIAGLKPGHYTRLGAAIRHANARLADETSAKRLLLVLTDGKPNDLDHYEGQHGIEDSRMAVREARRIGAAVHGVIVDRDGQDWFARIFGRGGFTLLPRPDRLIAALPEIYRSLTEEV